MPKSPLATPFTWNPGQHMAIIGMTGSGKSTLASRLLESREYCLVLRSKADEVRYPLTKRASSASALDDPRNDRLELQPRFEKQAEEFGRALDKVWRMGGFTVFVDETHYVDDELGLRPLLNRLLTQGRSPGRISVVCGMQRPTNVTRFAIGESSHVLSFGLEGRDVKILEQAAPRRMGDIVEQLPQHHFAWYHIPSRRMWLLAA
jgi:AAA domain